MFNPFLSRGQAQGMKKSDGKAQISLVVKYHLPSYIWNRWTFLSPGLLNRRVLLVHVTAHPALFLSPVLLTSEACRKLPPVHCGAVRALRSIIIIYKVLILINNENQIKLQMAWTSYFTRSITTFPKAK